MLALETMTELGLRVCNGLGYSLLASALCACSFVAEPWPGTPHELRAKAGYRCGKSFWYPLADTASTVASVTWVVRANNELAVHPNDQDIDKWSALRIDLKRGEMRGEASSDHAEVASESAGAHGPVRGPDHRGSCPT